MPTPADGTGDTGVAKPASSPMKPRTQSATVSKAAPSVYILRCADGSLGAGGRRRSSRVTSWITPIRAVVHARLRSQNANAPAPTSTTAAAVENMAG